jgi:hypothetical protein
LFDTNFNFRVIIHDNTLKMKCAKRRISKV